MIVDPALYLEYQAGANGRPDKVEAKLLLSKDFGTDWNVTFNGILEKSRGDGGEWERGFTVGVAKALTHRLTTGLEFKSGDGTSYLIPGAYMTLVPGSTQLNIGPAFGLTDKSDDFQLRTLVEYEF
jgi:hypothetical protein